MIRVRSLRFFTILAILGLCAPTVGVGWTLAKYATAAGTADPRSVETGLAPYLDDVGTWNGLARRELLRARTASPPKKAEAEVVALLSATPMNGGAWLDLAIARRAAGESTEDVAAALAMSSVTAPNEASFMAGRAAFALVFWDALPPDARRSLIADLIGGWGEIDGNTRAKLVSVLKVEPDNAGVEVQAALLTNGDAGAALARELFPAAGDANP